MLETTRHPLVFINFSSVLGPGLYDPKVSNKKVGNTMVYKERRMKFKASEVPGPGAYEVTTNNIHVPGDVQLTQNGVHCSYTYVRHGVVKQELSYPSAAV